MQSGLHGALVTMLLALTSLTATARTEAVQPATPTTAPACSGSPAQHGMAVQPSPIAVATPVPNSDAVLQLVADVPLPGSASRFDYQSFDPTTGRLYIAHMDAGQVVVFDTKSQAVVGTVDDLPTVTGVLVMPDLGRLYASSAGDHQVAVIDTQSLEVVDRVGRIQFPDGLDYVPAVGRIYVSDESGGGELVVDARTNAVATINVGGEAGNTHYDPASGCVFVAVQTDNQLIAIDPMANQVVGRFDLNNGCDGPHGFLIDSAARTAYVTCEDSAKLLVVDLTTMEVTGSFDVGSEPDVLALDPGLGWLYVASEAGVVSIFAEQGTNLAPVGEYVAPHAHSVSVDPTTHQVFLPLEDVGGRPVLRILAPATSSWLGPR